MTLSPKSWLPRLVRARSLSAADNVWRSWISVAGVLLLVAGVGVSAWYFSPLRSEDPTGATDDPPTKAGLPEDAVLYLVPPQASDDAPLAKAEFQAMGVTAVGSAEGLKDSVRSSTVAILVDRSYLPNLTEGDIDFLAAQFASGVITGGIQVSGLELASTLGVDDELAAADVDLKQMFQYTPGRSFYSFVYDIEVPGARCSGASSDYLDRGREVDDIGLKYMIGRIARLAEADCPRSEQ